MTVLQCQMCTHYWGDGKCEAYEDQIPKNIIRGEHDHRDEYKDDNGIRFERVE